MVVIRAIAVAWLVVPGLTTFADESGSAPATIWDGVYTESQAARGEFVYPSVCGRCHGHRLDGAPDDPDFFPTRPIAGPKFLRDWNGVSLVTLFEYTRSAMPELNPASLSDQEFIDLIAYMLAVSEAPAGSDELEPDAAQLTGITITKER